MIVDDDETSFGKYNACKETDELVRRLKEENKVLELTLLQANNRILRLENDCYDLRLQVTELLESKVR